MISNDQLSAMFREEAGEHLSELEAALLSLDGDPGNEDLIAQVFRHLHTIKGSAGMAGFAVITQFTHQMEAVFVEVRAGRIAVDKALVALSLEGMDLLRRMVAGEGEGTKSLAEALEQRFKAYGTGETADAGATAPPGATAAPRRTGGEKIYRVLFKPNRELFLNGTNVLGILGELADFGPCQVIAQLGELPALEALDPEACYLSWDVLVNTTRSLDEIRDVFIFVEGYATVRVDLLDDADSGDGSTDYKRLGEILVEQGHITTAQLQAALAEQRRLGDLLVKQGAVSPEVLASAVLEQRVVREARTKRVEKEKGEVEASIRVGAGKLDSLVDLVGELVIAQARLAQIAGQAGDLHLSAIAEDIGRLAGDLRDNTLNIRMVPIGTTFSRFKRLVHDLSRELGKSIDLVTEGAETELDKTVIDRLADPLVHLIRNSCDHGIEATAARQAAGKPGMGTVRLVAYQSGPSVIIEIGDDGAGLDPEAIRRKAETQGLISPEDQLSEREILQLIFLPGFSTAKAVSNISGRGVGMDVVKRSIEALRGQVEIEGRKGEGTSIRLRLPLTLAIIEGLLVAVGENRYVLPMSLVEECVELSAEDLEAAHGNTMATVRGELVPYLRLREWFGVEGDRPAIEQIAITSAEGTRFGLVVDSVIGQHQTVIKTLGRMYHDVRGLSGATILGDGTLALIVDVPALIHQARTAARAA